MSFHDHENGTQPGTHQAQSETTETSYTGNGDGEKALNSVSGANNGLGLAQVDQAIEEEVVHRVLTCEHYDHPLPRMGEYKPLPKLIKDRSQYRVEYVLNDPMCPLHWSTKRKARVTIAITYCTTVVAMNSSIWGPIITAIKPIFQVGEATAALGTCLYVLGFASGPLVWGPLSEYMGRRIIMITTIFISVCFSFAVATAKDYQTLMICRFFSGIFGTSSLSLVPSMLADMFSPSQRGTITAIYAFAVMGGPCLGPVISGFVVNSYLGWRWPLYITAILLASSLFGLVLFTEETFAPKVLCNKAAEMRERTGNWAIYAQHETVELNIRDIARNSIIRPVKMLFMEPILFLLSIYGGLVYGLLYLCLTSIPVIYTGYGWKGGIIELPNLSLFIGCMLAAVIYGIYYAPRYTKILMATGKRCVPEARLVPMMVAGPIFSIGIFWMCWSGAYPKTASHPNGCHWMVPVVGMTLFGYGYLGIFLSMTNYLVDSYLMLSASAVAANVFVRSGFAAGFPLFSTQMFNNLGIQWAGTLIGCLSVVLIPIPFLFYRYGSQIRSRSKYSLNLEEVKEEHLQRNDD